VRRGFCAEHGIVDLVQVEPVHVAAFVEGQIQQNSRPTVK
jgi:integrase/recombinase XerD